MSFLNKSHIRKLHSQFAVIMLFPLLITLISGSLFQLAYFADKTDDFMWLLDIHRGTFGAVNLENIYPFFNAFGLLMLAVTGISMWLQTRPRNKKSVK